MDFMKGWKTLAFNLALAIVGVAQAFDWTTVLGASSYTGWIVAVIAAIGMALRSVTTTQVGSSS